MPPDLTPVSDGMSFLSRAAIVGCSLLATAVLERRFGDPDHRGFNLVQRWVLGIGLWSVGAALAGAMLPALGAGLHLFERADLAFPAQYVVLVIVVDLAPTILHRAMHRLPLLWRLHAVHHADREFDAATSVRFHPGESLIRAAVDAALIWLLGPELSAIAAAIIFGGLWNSFEHGRFRLPQGLARRMEIAFVAPDVHRLHHAKREALHDANFGGVFTLWDRLFRTYRAPRGEAVEVGLDHWGAGDDLVSNLLAPATAPSIVPPA